MTSPRHRILERITFLLCLMLARASSAGAFDMTKSADDYFHSGAMNYLSNNIPAALGVVTNGLNEYPDSEKLQKLEALLKQQQQQQQNQQDQQQQDQQHQQSDPQQQNQDQQNQQPQPEQQNDQPPKEQSSQQNSGNPKEQQDAQPQQANAEQQQEMTPEQALRLLDSTKGDEQVLPIQQAQPPANRPIKDW